MKRKILTLILTIVTMIVSIYGLFACGMVEFKVNFVVDGVVYDTINTNGEEIIKMPENPTKDEYTFDGWFWDKDTWQTPFTANSLLDAPLSSDMNVYCKWKANTVNVESVSLDQTEISLHENDVTYLTATVLPENATDTSVVWESSNSTIATVVGGKVTALRIGSATITATTKDGGKIATCAVYVEPITVESVALNHTALSFLHGESKTLTATVLPSNATEKGVLWHSSNSSIASVESGTVKAVGYGTATITVTTVDGNKKATCSVEVIEDKITFNTLAVDGESVYGKVSNDTTTFSFIREITEHGNATYQIYKEITCETLIASKSISLIEGDNTVYVLQTVGKDLKLYTVTVRRRPMYDVIFNVNGGTSVEKQVIEEDYLATEPTTTRAGYTFTEWDYDFTKPITQATTVNAGWTAHTDTPYKVEYYLQNLEDDEYTLELTENKTGTTDTTADAEIKAFAHFTHTASATDSGNINGDGSTILKVYYTRDKYTVTFAGNGGTLVAGAEIQTVKYGGSVNAPTYQRTGYTFTGYDKTNYTNISESFTITAQWVYYTVSTTLNDENAGDITEYIDKKITVGETITITATTNEGYTWLGWYDGDDKVNDNQSYSFTMTAKNYNLTAKWKINQYTLTIVYGNGQADKVITQDYNSEIESVADPEREGYDFIGWDKTLPAKMPAENMTITAKWEINQYTLTIVYGNGQADKVITQDYCSIITEVLPDNLSRLNYEFIGWDKTMFATMPAENVMITAKWKSIFTYSGNSITGLTVYGETNCTVLNIPSKIDGVAITAIGDYAFKDCTRLTSVEIPDSVSNIGSSAFSGCSSLTEITLPFVGSSSSTLSERSDMLFGYIFGTSSYTGGRHTKQFFCSRDYKIYYIPMSLKVVTITGGNIPYGAFGYCDNLTSVILGDNVTSIAENAFSGCSRLTSITIPDGVTSIGGSSCYAFWGCESLKYNVKDNLRYLGNEQNPYLYLAGTSMKGIGWATIESTCKFIGYDAFNYCFELNWVKIPDSVISIGNYAFGDCQSLTSVSIGSNVTSIGLGAFGSSLTYITVSENNTTYTSKDGILYNKAITEIVLVPESITGTVTLPYGISSIGTSAFNGCRRLTGVVIPKSVTMIGRCAFADCDMLTSVVIPDSVTFIGEDAFRSCDSLTSVVIPDSVTSIGDYAFYDCRSLTSVVIGDSVTFIGDGAFNFCDSLTSVYYKGTAEDWNNITIGYNNSYLTSAKIYYYNEKEPLVSGIYWHYDENGNIAVW